MKPSTALAEKLPEVRAILARYPVANPRLFGSVARGQDREDSDLDLLVEDRDGLTLFRPRTAQDRAGTLLGR